MCTENASRDVGRGWQVISQEAEWKTIAGVGEKVAVSMAH